MEKKKFSLPRNHKLTLYNLSLKVKSNKIKKNKRFFFFRIKKDTAQREPTEFWRICMDYDKIRFYYVKDFETVKSILLKNFPDKIQII